jgi:ATP-binding cassette subfamily B protein
VNDRENPGPARAARLLARAVALSVRAHPGAAAGRVAVTVLSGIAPVLAAALLRVILDQLAGRHPAHLLVLALALGAVGGLASVLSDAGTYLGAQAGRAIQFRVTAGLFAAVTQMAGLRRLEDPAFQDRLRLAQQAGAAGPGQIISNGLAVSQAGLTLAGFLVTLAVLSPVLAVIVLLAAVPAVYAELGIARRRVALLAGTSHAERRQYFYANLLSEHAAAKEIRLFGLGEFFRLRMLAELRTVQRAGQRVDRREFAVYTGLAVLSALVAAGGIWWAVFAVVHGRLTLGDLSVLIAALGAVAAGLTVIITSTAMTFQALLVFRSYLQVVAEEPDMSQPPDPVPVPRLRRGITIEDVWFRYAPDQPWILRGVSLFIPRGQAVALVGHNGAGKSTLVKLLCRLYDPDRGRILWDGIDLRDADLTALRDHISVVFQDYMAYELSAADNIAVGDLSQAGQDGVLETAGRRAGVHDVLTGLPRGYRTLLSRSFFDLAGPDDPETGVLLSGGQWQRVALARAFLRTGRDLVVLDEPSSGLDAEAEHEIHARLRQDRADGTTVLISHRLNTVRDADQIVVLRDGVVTEQGPHEALMDRQGTYARLFTLQARGYAAPAAMAIADEEW